MEIMNTFRRRIARPCAGHVLHTLPHYFLLIIIQGEVY